MQYKVGIKTAGDSKWVFNRLRFETREEAERYAKDLFARWTAVREWTVEEEREQGEPVEPDPDGREEREHINGSIR